MTIPIFPSLIGLGYPVGRAPAWRTIKQEAISGKEYRLQLWTYPRYKYEIPVTYLGSGAAGQNQDWQTLVGFFNSVAGSAQPFLWNDPYDNAVTAQSLGAGDGSTAAFNFIRALGGFTEPVQAVQSASVYKTDWQGKQLQYNAARSNLLASSQAFTVSGLSKTSSTQTAPDGTATAQQYSVTAAADFISDTATISALGTATASIFVKPLSGTQWFLIALEDPTLTAKAYAWFDAVNGVIGATAAGGGASYGGAVIQAAANGYYRCAITADLGAGYTSAKLVGVPTSGNGVMTAPANGSAFDLWGAQLEAGAVPTSYIATVSGPVTVGDDITYLVDPNYGLLYGITFTAAPASGAAISWTGSYAWPCRFDEDSAQFSNFMFDFWELKKIAFETMKVF